MNLHSFVERPLYGALEDLGMGHRTPHWTYGQNRRMEWVMRAHSALKRAI
eukprot:CAMPEP_0203918884 /NCGR_PEP_ID=MMETSP0359-20131031/59389_1 /ASSEMBLY_ACC=CAM_ASM_000338 /TAXON_ID=268821 /ORGANISM="Scrippsiella Hangoei, Strain SHTV-5" /LENGTH=49 /DNA_ID= /DNA_START= /DNA_END= /DNA_ORIENTATION=